MLMLHEESFRFQGRSALLSTVGFQAHPEVVSGVRSAYPLVVRKATPPKYQGPS